MFRKIFQSLNLNSPTMIKRINHASIVQKFQMKEILNNPEIKKINFKENDSFPDLNEKRYLKKIVIVNNILSENEDKINKVLNIIQHKDIEICPVDFDNPGNINQIYIDSVNNRQKLAIIESHLGLNFNSGRNKIICSGVFLTFLTVFGTGYYFIDLFFSYLGRY